MWELRIGRARRKYTTRPTDVYTDEMECVARSMLSRVIVVGTSCSGKTTLAARLAETLGAPHIQLDALHWKENWISRDSAEFDGLVQEAIQPDRWIVERFLKGIDEAADRPGVGLSVGNHSKKGAFR